MSRLPVSGREKATGAAECLYRGRHFERCNGESNVVEDTHPVRGFTAVDIPAERLLALHWLAWKHLAVETRFTTIKVMFCELGDL